MKVLVTGSSGHLGEALVRTWRDLHVEVVGLDIVASPFTTRVGSIIDRFCVRRSMAGVQAVFHAATLHKPHVATHSRHEFVDVNITGTLNLLEEAVEAGVESFIYTSTTSVFGDALVPAPGAPAAWITEEVTPIPRNIYGITKAAAEDLCHLFHKKYALACLVLRTSRFFPEEDDDKAARAAYVDQNLKLNKFLYRCVDLEDVVEAHLAASKRAPVIGFGRYIISANTPFTRADLAGLRRDTPGVVCRRVSRIRGRVWTSRLEGRADDRPGVRERKSAARAGLAAPLRLPVLACPHKSRRRSEKPSRPPRRVKGVPCGDVRRRALSRRIT
jgi:nucleoside-diphosphate-sugar epimerase